MERKDVLIFAALCAGLTIGFGVAWATKPTPPIPDGIYLNGRALDLRRMSLDEIRKVLPDHLKFPAIPAQPDRKKKDGALGEVGEVAFDLMPISYQRNNQPNKPVEAFGIETLVQVLKELKEAFFGNPKTGTPGLRDDIAKGLGDFYSTLRTGCIVAGGTLLALVGWIALSLHRIAEKTGKAV